jgi:predicted CXXCH cytochrome family protein
MAQAKLHMFRHRKWRENRPRSLALIRAILAMMAIACVGTGHAAVTATPVTSVRQADAVCGRCHAAILRAYLETPMANASGLAIDRISPAQFFQRSSGVQYAITLENGSAYLSYKRPNTLGLSGHVKLLYFLGSGHLGRTYLYSIGNYLFESPIAYYAPSNGYDMKPGYSEMTRMPPAIPMTSGCMRCHMSAVQRADPGSKNHYSGAPFLHAGITCESCHGDASQHVATSGRAALVNPDKLDAVRRDSVCISCHLEGDTNVERRGMSALDYRPGQKIEDYLTYFVYKNANANSRGVSEIEQLDTSRCKRVSGDRMSCMSCHDPHATPSAAERVQFYRAKCLHCHSQANFAREHHPSQPDCTSCHMPKSTAQNIPHVAWTDHRILRDPQELSAPAPQVSAAPAAPAAPALEPLLIARAPSRDLALAYYDLVSKGQKDEAARARSLLAAANASHPGDVPVMRSLAVLEQLAGSGSAALPLYQQILKVDPADLTALMNLATLDARNGQIQQAATLWQQAFLRNEDIPGLGLNLATALCILGQRDQALHTLERTKIYDPDDARWDALYQRVAGPNGGCAGQR